MIERGCEPLGEAFVVEEDGVWRQAVDCDVVRELSLGVHHQYALANLFTWQFEVWEVN